MTSLLAVLSSIERFTETSGPERARLAAEIARRLGPRFRAAGDLAGRLRLPAIRDAATGAELAVVPGGAFKMGLTEEDDDAIAELVHPDDPAGREILAPLRAHARPARDVTVAPFLCARDPITHAQARAALGWFADRDQPFWGYGGGGPAAPADLLPGEARRAAEARGFRLPTEAELEYLAREGGAARWMRGARRGYHDLFADPDDEPPPDERGAHAFGVDRLDFGEWAADGWHDSYEGAPLTSAAWEPGAEPGVARGGAARTFPWQSPSEILRAHPAYRERATAEARGRCARFALDLPLDA